MDLTYENPWWNLGGLWQDPDLMRVRSSRLRYHPEPIKPNECKRSAVMTLRGPRRAGKTVALKLLVADLIEKEGWNPSTILWTNFETFRTLGQVEAHLIGLMAKYSPRLLLIDEATSVIGWQRVVKKLRDNGILEGICLILTGSSAFDLKAGAERMAGRRGDNEHPDRVLLPMSFLHFQRQLGIQTEKSPEIQNLFLRVGGFPFRVEGYLAAQEKKELWDDLQGFQAFDDILFYEFTRRKLDRTIALEVVGRIASISGSSTSYEGFAKPLSIAKETGRKYLDALGDAFLVSTFSTYDTSRARVAPKKDRKFAWVDPALGFLSPWLRQGQAAPEAIRAEWAVGVELLRRHEFRLWEGMSAPRNVFTWKSSSGKEIDFLVVDRSAKLVFPVEVKYQNSISDWDFQVIEQAFGKGVLVTVKDRRIRPKSRALPLEEWLTQEPLIR